MVVPASQATRTPLRCVASSLAPWTELQKGLVGHTGSFGQLDELAVEADQPARGNTELEQALRALDSQIQQLTASGTQLLDYRSHVLLTHVDQNLLKRLIVLSVNGLYDHFRT